MPQESVSQQQTTEQRRAKAAWTAVGSVPSASRDSYGSIIKKAPAMILTNGLAQALAFMRAKAAHKAGKPPSVENQAHLNAYNHISHWVMGEAFGRQQNDEMLLEELTNRDSNDYRLATTETLAYMNWLKRFVEARGLGEGE